MLKMVKVCSIVKKYLIVKFLNCQALFNCQKISYCQVPNIQFSNVYSIFKVYYIWYQRFNSTYIQLSRCIQLSRFIQLLMCIQLLMYIQLSRYIQVSRYRYSIVIHTLTEILSSSDFPTHPYNRSYRSLTLVWFLIVNSTFECIYFTKHKVSLI